MINIEQFRIGNFVSVDNIIRKICYLNNYGNKEVRLIGFEIDDNFEFESARSARLKSVMITDQLLISLGFTFHPYYKIWEHPRSDKAYSIELDNDYFPLDFSGKPIVQNMTHLHHLQNLFYSIQGEELAFNDTTRKNEDVSISS